jgi:hypothetical protein
MKQGVREVKGFYNRQNSLSFRTGGQRHLNSRTAFKVAPQLNGARARHEALMLLSHHCDAFLLGNLRVGDDLLGISGKRPLLVKLLRQRQRRRLAQ